ncbi:MAG: hypothetical protein ACYC1M_11095 [Armatimonadota bacterium]
MTLLVVETAPNGAMGDLASADRLVRMQIRKQGLQQCQQSKQRSEY